MDLLMLVGFIGLVVATLVVVFRLYDAWVYKARVLAMRNEDKPLEEPRPVKVVVFPKKTRRKSKKK